MNSEFKTYRKKEGPPEFLRMRPYISGEDLTGVSRPDEFLQEPGGMIAASWSDDTGFWYVSEQFFQANYVLAE